MRRYGAIDRGTIWCVTLLSTFATLSTTASGMTAQQLRAALESGEKIVIVDIRTEAQFVYAHVPGAISLPAAVLPHKKLPPFGRVVVCGDGIDVGAEHAVLVALQKTPGVQAELLEGGFLAWESVGGSTTLGGGMFHETFEMLTYDRLVTIAAENEALILLDLRTKAARRTSARTGRPVELRDVFPGRQVIEKVTEPAVGRRRVAQAAPSPLPDPAADRLYVLVDDGDGQAAEEAARLLRARGIRRVAILIGGDIALATEGAPSEITEETPLPSTRER